jgi:hypothetical protein
VQAPRAEAKIRTPLTRPVQHPAGHQYSGGFLLVLPKTSGIGFRAESPSEINRDVRPAFSPDGSSLTSAAGILDLAYTNQYPYPVPLLLPLFGQRESENLGGNYRETNEVDYRGALH